MIYILQFDTIYTKIKYKYLLPYIVFRVADDVSMAICFKALARAAVNFNIYQGRVHNYISIRKNKKIKKS